MLMRTRAEHDCKTVFAGGINPFKAAGLPSYQPASCVAGKPCITQGDILRLLDDGKVRLIREVAAELDGDYNTIGQTLSRMAGRGIIRRRMRPIPGKKSVPEYSLWSST